jgi:hypothetical protein
MKIKGILFSSLILALFVGAIPAMAAAAPGTPLCLPTGDSGLASECQELGPSSYLKRMSKLGLTFPLRALPAREPDGDLSYVPYAYARVTADEGRIYESLEAAIDGKIVASTIELGFNYVSYTNVAEVDGKKYYQINYNQWMSGADLSSGVAYTHFMGLEFEFTPARKFGWILQANVAKQAPGVNSADSNLSLVRWDVIQVYDIQEAGGLSWYMIGPDVWIDSRNAALVYPVHKAPKGVDNGRWIEINLYEQTVSVYENNQLVYATLVSTGVPGFWTRPGLFQITEKLETTPMTGSFELDRSDFYFLQDVPWTMYFDEARALHGAYWHTKLGYEQSHGCANLSTGDARWFYDWANVGDWVYVWDASGVTPTDPGLYGSGGA